MSKIPYEDKARIETLRKLGFGYRTIVAKFPEKGWKLCSVKAICKRVDERGSATERKPGTDHHHHHHHHHHKTYRAPLTGAQRRRTIVQ